MMMIIIKYVIQYDTKTTATLSTTTAPPPTTTIIILIEHAQREMLVLNRGRENN